MTVIEIDAKETTLNTEMATALEAAKVLTPATPEFDEAYQRYLGAKAALAKIPTERAAAMLAENAETIATCGAQIVEGLNQLIVGLKIEELLGTPVTGLRLATDAEGKKFVVFNPVTKIPATRKAGEAKTTGRTVIVDGEGNRTSITKFVNANLSNSQKLEGSPDYVKYPHTLIDTKPKFDAFISERGLTGYTYETPEVPVS